MAEIRTTSSTGGQKGVKLARFDLIPAGPLRELAEHYGRGARKYANHQWRQGYEWSKSIGALGRHFNDFMAGKDYDVCENDPTGCSFIDADGQPFEGEVTENGSTCFNHTGSHHMAAVAWHSFLLLEFKDTHQSHDDRYVADADPDINFAEVAERILGERTFELREDPTPGATRVETEDGGDDGEPPQRLTIYVDETSRSAAQVGELIHQRFNRGGYMPPMLDLRM